MTPRRHSKCVPLNSSQFRRWAGFLTPVKLLPARGPPSGAGRPGSSRRLPRHMGNSTCYRHLTMISNIGYLHSWLQSQPANPLAAVLDTQLPCGVLVAVHNVSAEGYGRRGLSRSPQELFGQFACVSRFSSRECEYCKDRAPSSSWQDTASLMHNLLSSPSKMSSSSSAIGTLSLAQPTGLLAHRPRSRYTWDGPVCPARGSLLP